MGIPWFGMHLHDYFLCLLGCQ